MDEDRSGHLDTYDILASKRYHRTESFVGAARELTQMAQRAGGKDTVLFADHWFRRAQCGIMVQMSTKTSPNSIKDKHSLRTSRDDMVDMVKRAAKKVTAYMYPHILAD